MTRSDWIEAFALRFARLSATDIGRARERVATELDGSGPREGSQSMHRDPAAMADDSNERDERPDQGSRL